VSLEQGQPLERDVFEDWQELSLFAAPVQMVPHVQVKAEPHVPVEVAPHVQGKVVPQVRAQVEPR